MFLPPPILRPATSDLDAALEAALVELAEAHAGLHGREARLERQIDQLRDNCEDLRASAELAALAAAEACEAMSERLFLAEERAHALGLQLLAAEAEALSWRHRHAVLAAQLEGAVYAQPVVVRRPGLLARLGRRLGRA